MKEGQEAIYYITADTLAAAKGSPQLEVFRKKGIEVLLFTDRVDEWMLSHLYEFDGKPLQSVAKGGVDLGKLQDEAEKKAPKAAAESFKPVLERLKTALKDRAKDVRTTTRLVDSPACIVVDEGDMSSHLARLLKQAGQGARVAADPGGERRTRVGQAPWTADERFRRPGADPVRPGPAGRRRPAGRPGGLRAARQPPAGGLKCQAEPCLGAASPRPSVRSARAVAPSAATSRPRAEVRKVLREGRVAPALGQPGAVAQHAQRAQRLDQRSLAVVEFAELLVALQQAC
jgi:hypothetical protein